MNAIFSNLTTDDLEESQDRVGGFQALESGLYTGTIKAAYAGQSQGGAHNVTFIFDFAGREYSETIYITNKKGENFFLNKSDPSKKVPLPGFTIVDDICLVTAGTPLAEQTTEEKVVNVYDYDAKKELPTKVQMLTGLLGQEVTLGILKTLENKSKKDANGVYQATPETREVNSIDKVFHTKTSMTVVEARQGADEPAFMTAWQDRNAGNTRDRREIKDGEGGSAGSPAAGAPAAQAASARPSLFA